ncbi:MAG: hypothetical protein ACQCN4_01085 [Candidatus Bathyarchaeia archaeon]
MHNKLYFAFAGVFLAVAMVVPMAVLVTQAENDLDNYIIIQNPAGMQTSGNVSVPSILEVQMNHQNSYTIIAVVEAVFLPLFLAMIYVGINHIHREPGD